MSKFIGYFIRFALSFISIAFLVIDMILNLPNGLQLSTWGILAYVFLILNVMTLGVELIILKITTPNVYADKHGFKDETTINISVDKDIGIPDKPEGGKTYRRLDKVSTMSSSGDLTSLDMLAENVFRIHAQDSYQLERYYVTFRNKKKVIGLEQADTKPLGATISYYDKEYNLVSGPSEEPFWYGTVVNNGNVVVEDIIIKANNEPVRLCVAARTKGQDRIYVFDRNSYKSGVGEVHTEGYELTEETLLIIIELNAANLDATSFVFRITDLGKENDPKITLLENGPELKRILA